jgi:uncharacterized protein
VIWILWHRRIGDLHQMQALATALGLPFKIKKLQFHQPFYAPIAKYLFDQKKSEALEAPWPDLIICAEALCSSVAKNLKARARGKVKIVALARPSGSTQNFDLVLTTPQYRLPKSKNIIELILPLTNRLDVPAVTTHNYIVVLVGASSPPEVLDVSVTHKLIADLQVYTFEKNLPLKIVTSPRTDTKVAQLIQRAFSSPHEVLVWNPQSENPYLGALASAAEIIVTDDSISMLSDALYMQKPVSVYRLPRRLSFSQKLVERFYKRRSDHWLFKSGFIEPTTDRWLLIDRLVKANHVRWVGDAQSELEPFDHMTDINTSVASVKRLLSSTH